MTDLNESGRAYARSLIAAGKVDRSSGRDFTAADGDALLGADGDWSAYAKAHLGEDSSETENTRARWKYPIAKGGEIYRSAVIAAKQRAAQQGDSEVEAAAADLLEKIDAAEGKSWGGFESRITPFELKFAEENGTAPGRFEGYGSVFNVLDDYDDVVDPGAFHATLAKSAATGRRPKMLLNHGGKAPGMVSAPHDLLPIGKWQDLSPDSRGLATRGQLINLDTESGKRIYGAMKEGELGDLSIGYTARKFDRGRKLGDPRRRLTAVDLHEISPVTFAANDQANITQVKSIGFAIHDMRDLETRLRDGGLSRGDAVKAVAVIKALLQRDAADPDTELRDAATSDDVRAIAARIRAATA